MEHGCSKPTGKQSHLPQHSSTPALPPSRFFQGCCGFTLLELMVVIAVIGLTMSLIIVRLDGITVRSRLHAAARKLASTIENVKTKSVAQGRNFYIDYDLDNHAYCIVLDVESQTLEDWREEDYTRLEWEYLPDGVYFEDITISTGEVWEEGEKYVGFTPLGSTDVGHIIHLVNEKEKQYSVEVNSITGMISFHEFYKEFVQIDWE